MAQLAKWATRLLRPAPLTPLRFPTDFKAGNYCPVNIADLSASNKYESSASSCFGSISTVWLARNLQKHGFVTLKIFARGHGETCRDEFQTYEAIDKATPLHPGHRHVRTALETFTIDRPGGDHQCLVQRPILLKGGLQHLLCALDYLHTECRLVHTGNLTCENIKADNILHASNADEGMLRTFVEEEPKTPFPRKYVDGSPMYMSQRFGLPEDFGRIVLSDFGVAVGVDVKWNHDAQPRRPLVLGRDPNGQGYTTRAHLAEVVGLLGPLLLDLLERRIRSKEFFSEDEVMFLDFVKGMLAWRPEDRKTARELLDDPWLNTWKISD
ncbi:hypothetical protein N657DRAFT_657506 [Parathielavia appendiculata]|uniref:non-specific serine/threonine protein kinase n=1 Tax=Parathielavia appendiculata TaxID=2587402 RepID=A0AAN6TWJ0_9PEZI|nr:hypothetical protein N657DRAFT_657506 [Parathielavia appendiculata]